MKLPHGPQYPLVNLIVAVEGTTFGRVLQAALRTYENCRFAPSAGDLKLYVAVVELLNFEGARTAEEEMTQTIQHHPNCTARYPEKPKGEKPREIMEIPIDQGEVVLQCSDCGAFVIEKCEAKCPKG